MKAIFEFNIPEDQWEFDAARQGPDMVHAISEFQRMLRDNLKYAQDSTLDKKTLEHVQKTLRQCLDDNNIADL